MRNLLFLALAYFVTFSSPGFAMGSHTPLPDLPTANSVDLSRYKGKWYEIARIDQRFEKDCVGVSAEYSLRPDGKVDVINTCRKNSCDGKVSHAKGIARVVDAATQSKLKVSFFWPFEGDYWILELGPDYSYSVVGSPDRKSFWILSRSRAVSETEMQSILSRFRSLGFEFDHLIKTQVCE